MPTERLRYTLERDLKKENIYKVGVIIFIVNQEGEILVVEEQSKTGHQEEIGVVCETRKEGETIWDNVLGGLVEEVGVRKGDEKNFWYRDRISYLGRFNFPEDERAIQADVVLILYSGEKGKFSPRNEVEVVGWMNPEDLLVHPKLRKGIRPSLQSVLDSGVISRLLSSTNSLRPLFEGVNIEKFFHERSRKLDLKYEKE